MEWVVVGSSPTAPEWLEYVRQNTESPKFAITNRAYKLFQDDPPPDIYFLGGEVSGDIRGRYEQFFPAAKALKKRGTRLVSLKRKANDLKEAGLDFMDEYIKVDVGRWGKWRFHPGGNHYCAVGYSGLFCLQYAVNHAATVVHCVGMEGYAKEGSHYFDGSPDSELNQTDVIQEIVQAVADACPWVEFVFYGKMNYRVIGQNVTMMSELPVEASSDGD